VYLTGGFKKPRELTWVSGALLSFLALFFGVSGYSLPWDEVGFWALQIVSAVPGVIDDFLPGVGSGIVYLIRGGFSVGQKTLSRTFTAHTLILPAGVTIISLLHFLLIRKQSVSGPLWRCWRCHVDLAQNWVCSPFGSFDKIALAGNFGLSGFLMVWCLPVPALSLTSSWSLASTGQPFNTLDLTNGPSIGNAVWTLQTFLTQ
jgi:quinol-cytochrome oxidoreductase complex cytochrome b subunit